MSSIDIKAHIPKLYSVLREYPCYKAMIDRCSNPNNQNYELYGLRGITVCDRWKGVDGFENFLLDVDWSPSDAYTLDRIDSNGNYEPNNVRWALRWQQQSNRRMMKNNSSGYIGIVYLHKDKSWRAKICVNGKVTTLGQCKDIDECALLYDRGAIFFKGKYAVTNYL